MLSKGFSLRVVKSRDCVVKSLMNSLVFTRTRLELWRIMPKNVSTKPCGSVEASTWGLQLLCPIPHYHTMPHFDTVTIYSSGKHCEKRRNCSSQAISPFLTMFSTLYGTYFSFQMHFKMSSAICFNLDQSNILSSGNGILYYKKLCMTPLCIKKKNCKRENKWGKSSLDLFLVC